MQVSALESIDKRVYSIDTSTGPKRATFVSESGSLQIIVQSRKPEARRLRKWVCDLAVRYAKGELTEVGNFVTADQLHAAITAAVTPLAEIVQQLAGVVQVLADRNPALRPVRLGSRPQQDQIQDSARGDHLDHPLESTATETTRADLADLPAQQKGI